MSPRMLGVALILIAVCSLTTAQFVIKMRLSFHGVVPLNFSLVPSYLYKILKDWWFWVGGFGLMVSSLLWYAGVSRLPLSLAYPFGALSYPLIFGGSILFLNEPFSWPAFAGNIAIVVGIIFIAGATRA